MKTHQRVWVVRAAVVVLAATAGLVGVAAPALADDTVGIDVLPPASPFDPGTSQQVSLQVQNKSGATLAQVNVSLALDSNFSAANPQGCSGSGSACTLNGLNAGETKQISFTITAKQDVNVASGAQAQKSGTAKASTFGGHSDSKDFQMTLNGPSASAIVPELSGVVVDLFTSKPIANATVAAQDSASPPHNFSVGTDKDGKFKITSKPTAPISPGVVAFVITKEGYSQQSGMAQPGAGQSITNLRFQLSPVAGSGTPSASGPSVSGAPTSAIEENQQAQANNNGGSGGLSWILIAIGAVLVLLGIGAIVLLVVRRRGDDDDRPGPSGGRGGRGGPPPGRGGPGGGRPGHPQQPRRGAPEPATRGPGGRPPGPGRGGDQTMIARSPLADAPTQMHGRVGPGQPGGPPQQGYGQNPYASNQYGGQPYGAPPQQQYPGGAPPNYGQPDPYGNAYGPQQHTGGYGQGQPGYDQYGQPQPPQSGYPSQGPYGQQPPPADPYDPRNPPRQPDRRVDWLDD